MHTSIGTRQSQHWFLHFFSGFSTSHLGNNGSILFSLVAITGILCVSIALGLRFTWGLLLLRACLLFRFNCSIRARLRECFNLNHSWFPWLELFTWCSHHNSSIIIFGLPNQYYYFNRYTCTRTLEAPSKLTCDFVIRNLVLSLLKPAMQALN